MHFYHLTFDQVNEMPYRRFNFLSRCVDRIGAEQDLRMLKLLAAVTSNDTYVLAIEGLETKLGEIVSFKRELITKTTLEITNTTDPEFDREGLHDLRAML